MSPRLAALTAALLLAFGAAAGSAHAQGKRSDQAVVPILDNTSGKVHGYLVLEPTAGTPQAGARWRAGSNTLDSAFGIGAGNSLALLCSPAGLSAINSLANNCNLAELSGNRATAGAAFGRGNNRLGVTVGESREALPAWLSRGNASRSNEIDFNDLTVYAQRNVGDSGGFVTIAGTIAKATLVPYASAPAGLADSWSSRSLELGGGYGAFSANIIGRVVDTPGQPKWEGLGLGLTWRTPWSGQLTVGAENVVTRGKNPFSLNNENLDEGTVPYVRYEQDL
ncbi:hypothetical protein E2F46_09230 [Luteimonas aestuarii]|uniref:Secreted protein n=1 Tax=Luteimonas aestuarii TaxID=453837 RepID=A0A4R5TTV5_9GAMM|nr:hypothetical protein E2F46_09230 [Luteimonas aestuarii]